MFASFPLAQDKLPLPHQEERLPLHDKKSSSAPSFDSIHNTFTQSPYTVWGNSANWRNLVGFQSTDTVKFRGGSLRSVLEKRLLCF